MYLLEKSNILNLKKKSYTCLKKTNSFKMKNFLYLGKKTNYFCNALHFRCILDLYKNNKFLIRV